MEAQVPLSPKRPVSDIVVSLSRNGLVGLLPLLHLVD